MTTYKLFRLKNGNLYPLYVLADKALPLKTKIKAEIGELVDETHVKAKGVGGRLSLRPGFHSTLIPFTDWIGKKEDDGTLVQRRDTVWCECEVVGKEVIVTERNGLRDLPKNWYYFKTNSKQKYPWIISDNIKIKKILTDEEVAEICRANGIEPQRKEGAA